MRRFGAIWAALLAAIVAPACARPIDPAPRTLILTAYAPEWDAMKAVIRAPQARRVDGRDILLGTLAGRRVVLLSSGVSMVNAAMATQWAIDHLRVRRIVFSGVAGGVDPALKIGDVAVPEHWGQYLEAMFARSTAAGWQTPAPSPEGAPENWQFIFPNGTRVGNAHHPADRHVLLDADPALLALARKVAGRVTLQRCLPGAAPLCLPHDPVISVGGVGVSAGVYADNAEFREYLARAWHARLLDMESASVIQVAYANEVPAIAFRSLSDLAGGDADHNMEMVFDRLAAANSARVVAAFVAALPN